MMRSAYLSREELHRQFERRAIACFVVLTLIVLGVHTSRVARGIEVIYVDNVIGSDRYDGRSEDVASETTGPVATVSRALRVASGGSMISLRSSGVPYYDAISLSGGRLTGTREYPLQILGNGAVLSGLRSLPPAAWQPVRDGLWKLNFTRKTHYVLLRNGKVLPEDRSQGLVDNQPAVPIGQWRSHRGFVYFGDAISQSPERQRFEYAALDVGITLAQIRHVRIYDLTVEHFRIDGIGAQNLAEDIVLENVIARENGRAGLAVGGASQVELSRCELYDNRDYSILVSRRGSADVSETRLDREPVVDGQPAVIDQR